jgi:hypothetical protein
MDTTAQPHDRESSVGNLSPAVGARNPLGIDCRTGPPAYIAWLLNSRTRFLESIPRPIAGL